MKFSQIYIMSWIVLPQTPPLRALQSPVPFSFNDCNAIHIQQAKAPADFNPTAPLMHNSAWWIILNLPLQVTKLRRGPGVNCNRMVSFHYKQCARLFNSLFIAFNKENIKASHYWLFMSGINLKQVVWPHKAALMRKAILCLALSCSKLS